MRGGFRRAPEKCEGFSCQPGNIAKDQAANAPPQLDPCPAVQP